MPAPAMVVPEAQTMGKADFEGTMATRVEVAAAIVYLSRKAAERQDETAAAGLVRRPNPAADLMKSRMAELAA